MYNIYLIVVWKRMFLQFGIFFSREKIEKGFRPFAFNNKHIFSVYTFGLGIISIIS